MQSNRLAKIVVTLGPSSSDEQTIRALFELGVNVFRLNFSHGTQEDHAQRVQVLRKLEREFARPVGILLDLQGPKLRLGTFHDGRATLVRGEAFRLDMNNEPGDAYRVNLPHPEIFSALKPGSELLLDDGKLRLRVDQCGADFADTTVMVGGPISDRKGLNVPSVILPISPLTAKDRVDLEFGLALGVDWVALSFVQRPEDIEEARIAIGSRAWIMAKLEKPSAVEHLDAIVNLCDGIMVARGDLGVELPPEQVPELQRLIVRACRKAGKPVVVATQMLESMVTAPVPTRAEVSDVATAVYDGVDAVMLSAESASGKFPLESVEMMRRIISRVEGSAPYRDAMVQTHVATPATTADAICASLRQVAAMHSTAVTVTYTSSGFTCLRAARERPDVPILCLTPSIVTARRMAMVWGVYAVQVEDVRDVGEMIERACQTAISRRFAWAGCDIVVIAGLPFGHSGTTNLLHVARIPG